MNEVLQAPLDISFDYRRSLGPVLSLFMTGLRDRRILGGRGTDGRVHVPPPEYDPATAAPVTDLVEVGQTGTVLTWSWMPEPMEGQPLTRPFAWVMVRLDGADTPLVHALDVAGPGHVSTEMRVRVRWAAQTTGHIRDIACFEPDAEPLPDAEQEAVAEQEPEVAGRGRPMSATNDVTTVVTPVHLHFVHAATPEESRFLRGVEQGRLLGQRCPQCRKVYVPPRGACPVDGVPTSEEMQLPDRGTVTTFCVVNVPFLGQRIEPPYVAAYVLLDGADIAFQHLILECAAADVRMGMRVEAVWKPRPQWGTTLESIDYFRPTGEPDAAYESYAHYL